MKKNRKKFQTFVVTGIISVLVVLAVPVFAQKAEGEGKSILVESSISGDVDPSKAITVKDLTIPLDEFELLVKPLTIEELQTEAAAWLLILKDKVQEISNTEIAIKQQNLGVKEEKYARKAVEEATTKLAEVEKALAEISPGTPEYEKATKNLEKAKEALQEIDQAVEKAIRMAKELEEDKGLQEIVKEAEKEEEITSAKKILEQAKKERDKLQVGSAAYNSATEKIDTLNQALIDLETGEKELKKAVADSDEYKKLSKTVDQARTKVIKAAEVISKSGLAPSEAEDKNSVWPDDTKELLEDISSNTDKAGEKSKEELEKVGERLEDVTEAQKDLKNQLVVNVIELQGEQTEIVDRFEIVLDSIDNKGGDTTSYRKYIESISGIQLNIADSEGLEVRVLSWITSEEGGLRWGRNIAKFVGIITASIFISFLAVMLTNFSLKGFTTTSALFRKFVSMVVGRGTIVVGFLLALTSLGISLGPILALLGGASFVLAFAFQNNLGNFVSGLMLLLNKPFDVGDEIKVAGCWAFVESITPATTKLKAFNGSLITLPNNTVWGGKIINYTHSDIRKQMIGIHVKFTEDLNKVHDMWIEIASANPKVLDDPAPGWFPGNEGSEDESYDYFILVRLLAWTKKDDYWTVHVELFKELQKRLIELHIELAAPIQEIHIDQAQVEMGKFKEITTQTSPSSGQDTST